MDDASEGFRDEAAMERMIETDSRGRVVLPGRRNERFVVHENSDGSLLLQPARVITEAQREYDTDESLRRLLSDAAAAKTVRRTRQRKDA